MFNDIHIGPLTLHMYGIMFALGFVAALLICMYRGKKRGYDDNVFMNILYFAIIGGLLGSRILYYITEFPHILKDPSILWNFKNGWVVYGGVIGGILANLIYFKVKKMDTFMDYFDIVMPSVAFAQGLGRIGCFCAGCCYGRETDAWYGVIFPAGSFAPSGVKLIPTQLLSAAGDFIIFGLLVLYSNRNKVKGRVAAAYLILYGIGRAIIEFFRNDYRGSVGILSTSQFISIGIVAIGILLYVLCGLFGKRYGEINGPESTASTEKTDSEE